MGITWEYAVFRCVGNIDIFRKKTHQNLLSLQGFFSENINIPHTTKHCIFPCNIPHYMYYYSCNNSGLTLKTGLVSLQKPLAVYFCSHLRASFGHSEDYWVHSIVQNST